jgi:D-aminopeptidase
VIVKLVTRKLGLPFEGLTGPHNAITDVPGVEVGYSTIIKEEVENLKIGKGPVRTGVTAILPRGKQKKLKQCFAGVHSFNGNGEVTGSHWIHDGGYFSSPICITNTHSVGIAHQATIKWMVENYRQQYHDEHLWALPVIAETYDGLLNDINGFHVKEEHVFEALNNTTSGKIEEGNVGGGTGMIAYEFKGGTGTSSRKVKVEGKEFNIGTLVQANYGRRDWLKVLGVPVGKHLTNDRIYQKEMGSIIVVIATDIPLLPGQLKRLAKRGSIGIGRSGSPGGNDSGDIFIAFSTANEMEVQQEESMLHATYLNDEYLDDVYEQTCHAIDEAVISAMLSAESVPIIKQSDDVHGKVAKAIDHEELLNLLKQYNRL